MGAAAVGEVHLLDTVDPGVDSTLPLQLEDTSQNLVTLRGLV